MKMLFPLVTNSVRPVSNLFLLSPAFPILYFLIYNYATISTKWATLDKTQDRLRNFGFSDGDTFDFIVVGSGSAGSVVTNRLIKNGFKVLLLEAGGELNMFHFVPAFATFLLNYAQSDWMYRTVPQKYASLNSINQQSSWSAGKCLGGTGSINLMIHLRGHKRDFDNWANLTDDPSWGWEGVLPYFKKYEDYEVPGDPVNHGYGGDLRIESPDYISMAPYFIEAAKEMGYTITDINAPFGSEGFDKTRNPSKRGVRQAPFMAFLDPIRNHPKLTILKFAHVNKILFRNGNQAYGVQFDRHGKTFTALASKEVILSAGAIGSPKILMLSGIGPRQNLEKFGIPLVKELPVGRNLQDHLGVYLTPFLLKKPISPLAERDVKIGDFFKYYLEGKGLLTNAGVEVSGLLTSKEAENRGEGDWPDIHLFFLPFGIFRLSAMCQAKAFNQNLEELRKYYRPVIGQDAFHVIIGGSRPLSMGYLELGGSSPYDMPKIDPRYLSDKNDEDFRVLLEAVKRTVDLVENSTSLGEHLGARFGTVKLPGCEHLEFRSDSYWECFIRRNSVSLHHIAGSVAMGQVVDSSLKVKGVRGLRVIDASVQPVIVTTNTQASTLMIAEKGAHMITEEWKSETGNQTNNLT